VDFDWAAILAREAPVLADAAEAAPHAPVPAAPEWDTTELLRHLGIGYARGAVVLRTGTMERPTPENGMIAEAPADGVVDWFRANLADFVGEIRGLRDPERLAYAFAPRHRRVGF
jgi:hypothetical protein